VIAMHFVNAAVPA